MCGFKIGHHWEFKQLKIWGSSASVGCSYLISTKSYSDGKTKTRHVNCRGNYREYWVGKIKGVDDLGHSLSAIPGPRCEGLPSGGNGDATTDDPSLQWSTCIPFLLGKSRTIHDFPMSQNLYVNSSPILTSHQYCFSIFPCCLKFGGKGNLENSVNNSDIMSHKSGADVLMRWCGWVNLGWVASLVGADVRCSSYVYTTLW